MLIIQPGKTMKILEGTRMTIGTSHTDEVDILVKGQLQNLGSIYTHTIKSETEITGDGTIFAHTSSRPVRLVEKRQIISYWPNLIINIPGFLMALGQMRTRSMA